VKEITETYINRRSEDQKIRRIQHELMRPGEFGLGIPENRSSCSSELLLKVFLSLDL